jgi:mono/diheme cytochrome c family protein
MRFYRQCISTAALVALAVLLIGLSTVRADNAPDQLTEQDVGRDIYVVRCQTCHGLHGEGTKGYQNPSPGPALQGDPFIIAAPPIAIANVIRHGRTGARRLYNDVFPDMPSFDASMIEDLRPLIAYLKGDMQKGK